VRITDRLAEGRLLGQGRLIRYLNEAVARITGYGGVWQAMAGKIGVWFAAQRTNS
jgi:hypothetical protein